MIIELIVILVVVGLLVGLLNSPWVPIAQPFRGIVTLLIVLVAVVWLLNVVGMLGHHVNRWP